MLDGLIEFRNEYTGKYWLEVFLLNGVTTTDSEIERLRECIGKVEPDKVQVNTVTRPPAEGFAEAVSPEQLQLITEALYPTAEVIADYGGVHKQQDFAVHGDDVLTLLQRRPCSVDDIAIGLGLHRNEVVKYIEELLSQGKIEAKQQNNRLYYMQVNG